MRKLIKAVMVTVVGFTLIWQTVWGQAHRSTSTAPSTANVDMQSGKDENIRRQELIRQKRAEVFKEMGWEEGKYKDKKEQELCKIAKEFSYDIPIMNFPKYKKMFNKDNISRPLVEFILDYEDTIVIGKHSGKRMTRKRAYAIDQLGWQKNKQLIPVFKHLLNDKDINVQISAANALYLLGEKKLSFETYERLVKEGIVIGSGYFKFLNDLESKPMLFRTIKYDNPKMQSLGLYYLAKMGEKESIMDIYLKLKKDWEKEKIDMEKHKNTDVFLERIAEEMGVKNE